MKKIAFLACVATSAALFALACSREDSSAPTSPSATSESPATDSDSGTAALAESDSSSGGEGTGSADAEAPPAEDPAMAERKRAVEFALTEQRIAEEPKGQWATTAEASSSFGDAVEQKSYSAWQATGAPNVERYGDDGNSWGAKDADKGIEWLEVGFAKPVHAEALRIRQTHAPGAIVKVELIDQTGARRTVFEGIDSTSYPAETISWFEPPFTKAEAPVARARITLATNSVPGWNEIDAVQLVGE